MNAISHVSPLAPARDHDDLRARALTYAIFSALLASPFDVVSSESPRALTQRLAAVAALLPHRFCADDVATAADAALDDPAFVRRVYSGLFEVGGDGPAVPLRADLVRNNETVAKEEVIRFYEHFGFALAPKYQWAPDHLSIMLEFMQVLILREAAAATPELALSCARAARDFARRHLAGWLPQATTRLQTVDDSGGFYGRVLAAANRFVQADLEWQDRSLGDLGEGY